MMVAALFLSVNVTSVLSHSQETTPNVAKKELVKENTKQIKSSTSSSMTHTPAKDSSSTADSPIKAESSSVENQASVQSTSSTQVESETTSSTIEEPTESTTEGVKEQPATTTTQAVAESVATPVETSQQANQLKINNQLISYTNAGQANGQALIDANPNMVATWGGVKIQSGEDGGNTHFIGHNPGIFNLLFSTNVGSTISISDSVGNISDYTVSQIVTVDDSGIGEDGTDYWEQITSTGGGERVTLQTCIDDDHNLIVFATK